FRAARASPQRALGDRARHAHARRPHAGEGRPRRRRLSARGAIDRSVPAEGPAASDAESQAPRAVTPSGAGAATSVIWSVVSDDTSYKLIEAPGAVPIKAWVRGVPLEDAAEKQLRNVARLPFIHRWVAAMPDVHWGIGATVGSVIPTVGAIVPAAVGVDIGCGMMATRTSLLAKDLPDDLRALRSAIERAVPHGRTDNGGKNDR